VEQGHKTASQVFTKTMVRPWILLFLEPIVLLLSIYMAISEFKSELKLLAKKSLLSVQVS
jgi:hypothetical protein